MLPKIVSHLDEPIGDPAAINTFLICNKAKENNEKACYQEWGWICFLAIDGIKHFYMHKHIKNYQK